jgi:hypothetical protein
MIKRTRSFELIHIIYRIEIYCMILYTCIAIIKLIYLLFIYLIYCKAVEK